MGCEATGSYHQTLARVCAERGYTFKVLNPILTKQFTRGTIRKRKTDRSDALIIAKLLAQGEGYVYSWNADVDDGKTTHRVARRISGYAVGMMQLRGHLETSGGSAALLERIDETVAALRKHQDAHEQLMQDTYGKHPDVLLLRSIIGIGPKLSTIIWSEIGDINRFDNAKQLVAFAGLDPRVRQSGHTLNKLGRLTKRGSPHLRRALFLAANGGRRHDPDLKAYYLKKRGEGKKHTVATCATARKVAHRIFAVWSRRTPYTLSTVNS